MTMHQRDDQEEHKTSLSPLVSGGGASNCTSLHQAAAGPPSDYQANSANKAFERTAIPQNQKDLRGQLPLQKERSELNKRLAASGIVKAEPSAYLGLAKLKRPFEYASRNGQLVNWNH